MLILANVSEAEDFQIIPSLAVRQEYNSNIFFSESDKEDDFITTISPGLEISEKTELLDMDLVGRVAPFFYWHNSGLNDVDQDYRGRFSYRLTERFDIGADAGYRVDNRPDREVAVTGLVFDNRKQYLQRYDVNAAYAFDEITSASVFYSHDRTDSASDNAQAKEEDYFRGHSINFGLSRNLDDLMPATTGHLNGGYGHYDYKNSTTKSYYGGLGLEHMFSEKFSGTADIGVRYVTSDFETVEYVFVPPFFIVPQNVERSNSGWGAVGSGSLSYKGLQTGSSVTVSHDLRTGSGTDSPTTLTRFMFDTFYLLDEKFSVGLSTGYFRNRAEADDFSSQEIDQDTFNIQPRLRWEFYPDLILEGACNYTCVKDNADNTTADQFRAFLQISYGYSLLDLIDVFTEPGRMLGHDTTIRPGLER